MGYVITAIVSAMIGATIGVVVMCLMYTAGKADEHNGSK
ncbi:MAG: DUF3789 domain-containing protein [Clostridia bacterium]|nr:DUF3789 domain-containing protein [Clostridia bacterium]